MTNVLIKKKKKRRKHRHIEKKAIWSWKQRLEFCIYKPRNVNNSGRHQKLGINSPLEPQEGINTSATLILDFWTTEMESQTWAWLSLLFLTLIVDGISKNLCCCHPLAPRIVIIYYILYYIWYTENIAQKFYFSELWETHTFLTCQIVKSSCLLLFPHLSHREWGCCSSKFLKSCDTLRNGFSARKGAWCNIP